MLKKVGRFVVDKALLVLIGAGALVLIALVVIAGGLVFAWFAEITNSQTLIIAALSGPEWVIQAITVVLLLVVLGIMGESVKKNFFPKKGNRKK